MKAMYQWLTTVDGARVFRVSNLQTGKSIDVPFAAGLARIAGSGLHGARTNDELLVAKVVCDRNADVDGIKKWLAGPDRGRVIDEYEKLLADKDRELRELRAKLDQAA